MVPSRGLRKRKFVGNNEGIDLREWCDGIMADSFENRGETVGVTLLGARLLIQD